MSCREYQAQLVSYVMNELPSETMERVEEHVAGCGRCAARLSAEKTIQETLAAESIPAPSPDFELRVLAAARQNTRGGPRYGSLVGGAIAAILALGIGLGVTMTDRDGVESPHTAAASADNDPASAPMEQGSLQTVRLQTVRLAFTARESLDDVTLTLELPPNVEIAKFPGRHLLAWQVSLKPGDNYISLPLRVMYPQAGELVAHLDDGRKQKTFRVPVPSTDNVN